MDFQDFCWTRKVVWCLAPVMLLVLAIMRAESSRDPALHRVGGKKFGWLPNLNYTGWSTHEHFYVGDWLYFGFDKRYYNVLEVNETGYENCIDKDFIKNITRGGRDVFNLTEEKPYYFISGGGYCFHGMKLAVYVERIPPTPPSPLPPLIRNGSPSNTNKSIILHIGLIVTALVLTFKTY